MSSINKIHVNSSTNITLNDRFTVIQSVVKKSPTLIRKNDRRRRPSLDGAPKVASVANRKLLEQLETKHKIQAALKLKRRSLKAILPSRQRIQNRIGLKKGAINAMRLAPNGKLARSNSLSNIATMKADLIEPSMRRSNSTSSLSGRLGPRRRGGGGGGRSGAPSPRRQLKRNTLTRTSSRQNLSRSNSTGNLKRSNSKINLRRTNSRNELNGIVPPAKRININRSRLRSRSASRSRRGSTPITSRLGVRKQFGGRQNLRGRGGLVSNNNRRGRLNQRGVARGRIVKRRNSTGNLPNGNRGGAQQGRISRPRGRGGLTPQGNRNRSQNRQRNSRSQSRQTPGGGRGRGGAQQRLSRGRSRGRGRGRGINRPLAQRGPIKKEDLDKELDQYMANTKTAFDRDVYMN